MNEYSDAPDSKDVISQGSIISNEKICIFCRYIIKDRYIKVFRRRRCNCKYYYHKSCYRKYFNGKCLYCDIIYNKKKYEAWKLQLTEDDYIVIPD